MIKVNDLIEFSETDKVVVLDVIQYKETIYAFVNQILPDESDVTDEYHVMSYDKEDNTMLKITDENILKEVAPIFGKRIEDLINRVLEMSEGQQ